MSEWGRVGRATSGPPFRVDLGRAHPDLRVGRLLDRGLKRQAARMARLVALRSLRLPSAMLLAGRLAPALGAARLGDALVFRAARLDPGSPVARYHAARALLSRQGPLVTWLKMQEWGGEVGAAPSKHVQAGWLALRATVAASFRDFRQGEAYLQAAERLVPGLPCVATARAHLLLQDDRRKQALAVLRETLRLRPWSVDSILTAASTLLLLGRVGESCDLLLDAAIDTEDSRVVRELAAHLAEQRRFRECLEWLERYEAVSPLLDREGRYHLGAMRSRARDQVGAPRWSPPGTAKVAAGRDRVLLDVPFVAQDRYTCSPATLTELAAFWRRSLDSKQIAESICHLGTPHHRARAWAEQHGWGVQEFRVTWESARALLRRGIPFALATRCGLAGHHQAVVGYDAQRASLLIRCPSRPLLVEMPARWLATQAWCGPRGTALVPAAEGTRLAGLELPDAVAYDQLHAIELALSEHRRKDAGAAAATLARRDPRSRLNLWAALELASYDEDHSAAVRTLEALLVAYPGTPALELARLLAVRQIVSPEAYSRMLAVTCRRHPRDLELQSFLALDQSLKPERASQARRTLRPLLRRGHWPTLTVNLASLANICEAEGALAERRRLIELAARADDLNERPAMAYFECARDSGDLAEAVAFLDARQEAYGRRSGEPAQTLFSALREAGKGDKALGVLAKALVKRKGDFELRLFAARACATAGRLESAKRFLTETRGRTHRGQWLRAAAAVASASGDQADALRLWRELLEFEPAAVDAHQAVAGLLIELGSRAAADAHLRSVRSRFPGHYALCRLGLAES